MFIFMANDKKLWQKKIITIFVYVLLAADENTIITILAPPIPITSTLAPPLKH